MKLPQVLATEGVPGSLPYREASGAAYAAPSQALAEGAYGLERVSLRIQGQLAEAQAHVRAADAKLEYEQAMSKLEKDFVAREQKLRDDGVDPQDYPKHLEQAITELRGTQTETLRYPEAKAAFQIGAERFQTRSLRAANIEAEKMKFGRIALGNSILQREDAITAVSGDTPLKREEAHRRGLERPMAGFTRGVYSREQADAMTQHFVTEVERGSIQRDLRDPIKRTQVIGLLLENAYKLPAAEQFSLAQTAQNQSDAEYKTMREATDKWFTEQKEAKVGELFRAAANKTLDLAQLEIDAKDWNLSRTDYDAIRTEMGKPLEEPASDPATLRRLDADVHSQYPRTTERELLQLRQTDKLNRKDYLSALDRLRETREGLLNRGDSRVMQDHTQAEQEGLKDLGIPTLYDKLDAVKEKIVGPFLRELRQRSAAYPSTGGQENPLKVKDEIIPRYKKLLDQEAQLTIDQTRKLIKPEFPTPEALEAAYRARPPQITKGEYEAQKRLFLDLDTATQIQKENARRAAERPQKPSKGGAPRPTDRP